MKPLTIHQRAQLYNEAFPHLPPLVVTQDETKKPFLFGYWFVGGGNVSNFYGSYQTGYLTRISALFPDCKGKDQVLHLFSGSLPPSPDYSRVGVDGTGEYKADLEIDAHYLSVHLKFRPALIFADPPYSEEDSEHYKNSMVNRSRIIEECALVLQPGGWIAWMDQALPVFSNKSLRLVGVISYIRSTGNRFRCVCLFQKPANCK